MLTVSERHLPRIHCPGFCGLLEVLSPPAVSLLSSLFSHCSHSYAFELRNSNPETLLHPTESWAQRQVYTLSHDFELSVRHSFSKVFLHFLLAEVTVLLLTLYFFLYFRMFCFIFHTFLEKLKNKNRQTEEMLLLCPGKPHIRSDRSLCHNGQQPNDPPSYSVLLSSLFLWLFFSQL